MTPKNTENTTENPHPSSWHLLRTHTRHLRVLLLRSRNRTTIPNSLLKYSPLPKIPFLPLKRATKTLASLPSNVNQAQKRTFFPSPASQAYKASSPSPTPPTPPPHPKTNSDTPQSENASSYSTNTSSASSTSQSSPPSQSASYPPSTCAPAAAASFPETVLPSSPTVPSLPCALHCHRAQKGKTVCPLALYQGEIAETSGKKPPSRTRPSISGQHIAAYPGEPGDSRRQERQSGVQSPSSRDCPFLQAREHTSGSFDAVRWAARGTCFRGRYAFRTCNKGL